MSGQEIVDEVMKGNAIFARASPEQKLRIVTTLKKSGEVVAVTDDDANDAPPLKKADIGIARADVAGEASDMILLDDSFASIVKAVESGRTIYENLRKFIVYVFCPQLGRVDSIHALRFARHPASASRGSGSRN